MVKPANENGIDRWEERLFVPSSFLSTRKISQDFPGFFSVSFDFPHFPEIDAFPEFFILILSLCADGPIASRVKFD